MPYQKVYRLTLDFLVEAPDTVQLPEQRSGDWSEPERVAQQVLSLLLTSHQADLEKVVWSEIASRVRDGLLSDLDGFLPDDIMKGSAKPVLAPVIATLPPKDRKLKEVVAEIVAYETLQDQIKLVKVTPQILSIKVVKPDE